MDFKTFKEEVKENVRAHLPKEAKDVELSFGTAILRSRDIYRNS